MDTTCAVCRLSDGLVINIIVASAAAPAPENCQLIAILPNQWCDIGAIWNGAQFDPPDGLTYGY